MQEQVGEDDWKILENIAKNYIDNLYPSVKMNDDNSYFNLDTVVKTIKSKCIP